LGIFLFIGLALAFLVLVPLIIKWELNKRISLIACIFVGISSGVITFGVSKFYPLGFLVLVILEFLLIMIIAALLILWRFYRDPERKPPEEENSIISPADGTVIYIKRIENGEVPFSEKNGRKFPLTEFVESDLFSRGGYIIGISMTFLDVHVNRAPIAGRVALIKHIKGQFFSLKKKDAILKNERVLTVLDNDRFKIGIVQIASRLVRRIVPYIQEANMVLKGERIGMIKFGSQVDLIVPDLPSLKIEVKPQDYVKAGITRIAVIMNGKSE